MLKHWRKMFLTSHMFSLPNECRLCDRSSMRPNCVPSHRTHAACRRTHHRWTHLLFSGKTGYPLAKEWNWTLPYTIHKYTKINSNWIKNLNIRPKAIQLLEESTGEKLLDIGLGDDILDLTPKVQTTKAKLNKRDYIKLKASAQQKKHQNEKKIYVMGEDICKPYIW